MQSSLLIVELLSIFQPFHFQSAEFIQLHSLITAFEADGIVSFHIRSRFWQMVPTLDTVWYLLALRDNDFVGTSFVLQAITNFGSLKKHLCFNCTIKLIFEPITTCDWVETIFQSQQTPASQITQKKTHNISRFLLINDKISKDYFWCIQQINYSVLISFGVRRIRSWSSGMFQLFCLGFTFSSSPEILV